jgi:hypothetical protein
MATDGLLMAGHLPNMHSVYVQGQAATGIHVRPPFLMVYGLAGTAAVLMMPLLYSGQRGFATGWLSKYFFYAFYPLHLMIIWLLL